MDIQNFVGIILMLKKLRTLQFDIETTFFYSDLDEEINMKLPDGYVKYMLKVHNINIDPSTDVILLMKAIYGLDHAARQWWKIFKEVMATSCDYCPSKSDPCLFIKKTADGEPIFLSAYTLMMGNLWNTRGYKGSDICSMQSI
jgi:hypothetical protein